MSQGSHLVQTTLGLSGRRQSGTRAVAAALVIVSAIPIAYVAAVTPSAYRMPLVLLGASPIALVIAMRLPIGALLAIALVTPPLVQFVASGGVEGIPAVTVLPLFGPEAVLLVRGLALPRGAPRVRLIEVAFLGAILYAAAVGLAGEGDRRVWFAELAETSNLVVMLWLLRLNRVRFEAFRMFVIVGHLVAAPFFAWYVLTRFGEYRVDFFFGITATLVPLTAAVLLHMRLAALSRVFLIVSCFAMIAATAAAGIRGTTLIALLGTALVVLFSLRRFSTLSITMGVALMAVMLLMQPVLIGIAGWAAPEAADRFRAVVDSPTLSVRLLEAEDALAAFRERPGGHGLGAILVTRHEIVFGENGISIEYGPTTYIHNSYAWYLAKTGLAGFLALILMLLAAVLTAIRHLPRTTGGASFALALLLGSLAGAWGGPALHNVFLTGWLALAIYLAREPGQADATPRPPAPTRIRSVPTPAATTRAAR